MLVLIMYTSTHTNIYPGKQHKTNITSTLLALVNNGVSSHNYIIFIGEYFRKRITSS